MATTTLPPGAEITLDDHGSGRPPELTPRPARVTGAGSPSQKSETGMWVAVSAIGMSFAAFTSAMFVRQDSSTDWQHFQLPHVLYLNTLILIASSVTLEFSRQRFAAISDAAGHAAASAKILLANGVYWLYLTAALGLLFVLGQLLAWRNLVAQGLFLATNPSLPFSTFLPHCTPCICWAAWAACSMCCASWFATAASRGPAGSARFPFTGTSWICFGCICYCCSRSECSWKFEEEL